MSYLLDALAWIFGPGQWSGDATLLGLLGEHLLTTLVAVLVAVAIAVPLGWSPARPARFRRSACSCCSCCCSA
jgi:osmoprotectant transport system permease protein